jgi:hypothetical protein
MNKVTTIYTSTKVTKDHDAVQTKLTLDYSNLTDDQVRAYADDACTIKAQTMFRSKGIVPKEYTYVVPVPGTRAVAVMSEEQMLDALAKKFGGDAQAIIAAVQARLAAEAGSRT